MHLSLFFYDFEECLYVESEELKLCWPQSHENFSQVQHENFRMSPLRPFEKIAESSSKNTKYFCLIWRTFFCFSLINNHISSRNLYFIVFIVFNHINTMHEFKSGFVGLKCLRQWIPFSVTFSQQLSSIRSPFIWKLQ